MDFYLKEKKDIETHIIQKNKINLHNIIINTFLDNDYITYVYDKNKFIGVINKNSLINFDKDINKIINLKYPTLKKGNIDYNNIYNLALENNAFNIPIIENEKIIKEYVIKDRPLSLFSMNKDRWQILYSENKKVSDYIKYKKTKLICICGSFSNDIKAYIDKSFPEYKTYTIDNSYQAFLKAIDNNALIIDTNDELKDLKTKILRCQNNLSNKENHSEYLTLYELCNFAELLYFKKFIMKNQIETNFFIFPNVETFKNLSQQEQYRIKFDKHYRYYYNNLQNDEILNLVKKVFGNTYSKEFIKSRNQLSGLEFKNGICYLQNNNNPFCKAINGTRYTTDKNSYYKNCIALFGACLAYGAMVDDSHTIASCLQRLINANIKDYEVYNYGARNLSLFESIRIATNLKLSKKDKMCFIIIEPEYEVLKNFDFKNNFFNFQEMFDEEKDMHDYFLDEPMHCNHICSEKLSNFIYNKIGNNLENKLSRSNSDTISKENLFKIKMNEIQERIDKYIEYLRQYHVDKDYCSLVLMHANPFTTGHYKLVEYASKNSDHVFVMLALESGMFNSEDVFEMASTACKDFNNVTVIKDRTDIIPRQLFLPGYFERDDNPNGSGNTLGFIDFIGKVIKPALNIKERFLGSEPVDVFTRNMNKESAENLPKYGIKSTEIPRFETPEGIPYSAKTVRNALKRKDWETIKQMVPPITEKLLHKYEDLI